jgi:DNA-binding NtrC family response regulator
MKSVLFLEDEHAFRTVFSEVLRNEGVAVLQAADMSEAVQACSDYGEPVDIAIIDRKNGIKAAQELAQLYPGLRVLFIGDAEWAPLVKQQRELKAAWLQKSFTSEALLRAIRGLGNDRVPQAGARGGLKQAEKGIGL